MTLYKFMLEFTRLPFGKVTIYVKEEMCFQTFIQIKRLTLLHIRSLIYSQSVLNYAVSCTYHNDKNEIRLLHNYTYCIITHIHYYTYCFIAHVHFYTYYIITQFIITLVRIIVKF